MTALARYDGSAGVGKLHEMMIKNLAVVFARTNFTPAHALCCFRIFADKPVGNVNIMNVLLQDMVAAEPVKVVPVSHLILHLCHIGLALAYPHSCAVPVNRPTCNVSHFTVLNAL